MKKMIALVLALVMTLSLLPMNVWATDGGGGEGGGTPVTSNETVFTNEGDALFTPVVKVFTALKNDANGNPTILTCDIPVEWQRESTETSDINYVNVTCTSVASQTVYLATGVDDTLAVSEPYSLSPVGTWKEGEATYKICALHVTKPTSTDVNEATCTVTHNSLGKLTFVFDFTPTFTLEEGSRKSGNYGVNVFTALDATNKTLNCDNTVQENYEGITVYCSSVDEKTVYLTADGELSVKFGENSVNLTPKSTKWINGKRICKVYPLTVSNPGNNGKVTYTVTHGVGTPFNLVFDFTPIYTTATDVTGCEFRGITFFTGTTSGNKLTYNGAVSGRGTGEGEGEATLFCPAVDDTATKTLYLAVPEWVNFSMEGKKLIGKWETTAINDKNEPFPTFYDVYELTTQKPSADDADKKIIYTATAAYNDGNSTLIDIIFDFNVYPNQLWCWWNGSWTTNQIEMNRGSSRNFKLAFGKATGRTNLTQSNCEVELIGYVGELSWVNNGTELVLNSSSATGKYGKIKVTMKDSDTDRTNNPVYELPVCVYSNAFALHGVEIYTDFDDGDFFYQNDADYDGISMSGTDTVNIPCRPNQDKMLYLVSDETITNADEELPVFQNCPEYSGKTVYCLKMDAKNGGFHPAEVAVGSGTNTKTITFNFMFNGVFFSGMNFCTVKDSNGGLTFEDRDTCDNIYVSGWYDKATNRGGTYLSVPFISGLEKTLYMIPARGDIASVEVTGGSLFGKTGLYRIERFGSPSNRPMYFELTLSDTISADCNAIITYKDSNGKAVGEFEIRFERGAERRIVYYTSNGTSRIIVTVLPGVDEVVEFPAAGVLPNDTLTLTVKALDDTNVNLAELWRPLMNDEDGCWVPYTVEAIAPPTGATGAPGVAVVDCEDELKDAYAYLEDLIASRKDDAFEPYFGDDPTRQNAAIFAWSHEDSTTGTITIIPQTEIMTRVWCWRYLVPRETGMTVVDQKSGFTIDVQLEEGAANAVTLDKITYPTIPANRVSMIQHEGLDSGNDKVLFPSYDAATGVLTYAYVGARPDSWNLSEVINATVLPKADLYKEDTDNAGNPIYQLLRITAPSVKAGEAPYNIKEFSSQSFAGKSYGTEFCLPFMWHGVGTEENYLLTWCRGEGSTYEEITEQISIKVPSVDGIEPWMAHVVFEEKVGVETVVRNIQALPVDEDRLSFTDLKGVQGVTSHVYDITTGKLFTTYTNNTLLDIDPVLDATFSIEAPAEAIGCYMLAVGGDGTSDPAYNNFNAWKSQYFWGHALKNFVPINDETVDENGNFMPLTELNIGALNYQAIGNIEYYYSADLPTRYVLLKWVFPEAANRAPIYEYLQLDTTSYFCQWEEVLKSDNAVTDEVDVPTATLPGLTDSDIKLVARIHPQKQEDGYGQYFFELDMVKEGEGNVYTDPNGDTYFTIILPYSFMGEDWNYAKAKNLKEKPMITHFDKEYKQLAGDKGTITGEYTERGIEFKVNSFSPFTVSWTEDTKPSIGGYTPSVTPDVSMNIDSGSLNEAALAVGSAIDNGSADITPAVGYTKADIEKLQQDSKLKMGIEKSLDCSAKDKETIDAAISKTVGTVGASAAQYFDITVVLKHEDTGATVGKVRDTKTPISITVDLDSELQQAARAGKYLYVVRCHDGKTAFLKAELNTDKTKVMFSTSLFSAYAVVALDKEVPVETASVAKPVTPPAQETVTPEPEDITPEVVPDEPPVIDDGAVDDAPAVDEPQGGNAGLWIGVGIVALAAIVVVLAVMAVRKKRKD